MIGNPLKFWLGFVSIWFDIVFMLQHYVFYPVGKRREAVEEEEGQRRSKKGDELEQEGDEEVSRAMLHDHESGRALATRYDTIPSSSA